MKNLLRNRLLAVLLVAVAAIVFPKVALAAPLFVGETTDVSDINEAMKIYFTDPIVVNVVTDTEILDLMMEDNNVQIETTTGGRYIETAQYFRLPAGAGFRTKGDYLPVPGAPKIKNSRVYLKKGVGVVQMEGEVMERVRTNMGAYIDYMDRAMPDFLERFNDNLDRAALGYGNGAKGKIAQINGLVITVDSALGVTGWTDAWLQFQEGESLVASADADASPLRNANGNGGADAAIVEDVDNEAGTITVNAVPGAWAPGDFLFGGDVTGHSGQAAGEDREMIGLAGMVDDGSILQEFQGLDRNTYRLWRGNVIDGNSGNFSGDLDEQVMVHADNQAYVLGKGMPNTVVTSRTQADRYWWSLKSDRTFNDPKSYEGGRGKLWVRLGDRVVPIRVSRKMPPQLAYMLQTDTFRRWQVDGGKWDDKTGAIWNRVTDGVGRKDDFYAVYLWYLQLGNIAPRKNVRIQNLQA
jgi:hypothetical protein